MTRYSKQVFRRNKNIQYMYVQYAKIQQSDIDSTMIVKC